MTRFGLLVLFILKLCVCTMQKSGVDITEFHFDGSDQKLYGDNRESRGNSKFVDVFTNPYDVKDVQDNFYEMHPQKKDYHKYNSEFANDRKDTLNFPNIENLFSTSNNEVLQSDYGDFITPYQGSEEHFSGTKSVIKDPDYLDDIHSEGNKYLYHERPQFYTKTTYQHPTYGNHEKMHEKDKNNLGFLQNHMVIPDSENYGSFYLPSDVDSGSGFDQERRPSFWTKRHNFSLASGQLPIGSEDLDVVTYKPQSYVQTIPSLNKRTSTSTISSELSEPNFNRYEEVDLSNGNIRPQEKQRDTKKQINDMMKKYLAKILVEKYGIKKRGYGAKENKTTGYGIKNNRKYSGLQNGSTRDKDPKTDQESKFLYSNTLWDLKNKTISKIKQFFSLFTIIKFNNTECNATNWAGTWQGVCLTSTECTQRNGTALGNCASGYGTCCVFRGSCGDSSSMNCSYFKSPNYPDYFPSNGGVIVPTTTMVPNSGITPDPRLYWYYYNKDSGDTELDNIIMGKQSSSDATSCAFRVFKTNRNVQQFRIDFIDLDLAGPTNGTCTIERLIITGQNANDQIPVICGYNTGQHVYIDVSQLNGPLQIMVLSTTGTRKRFKLRICQYTDSCGSSQSNCLQYYTGISGIIQSFNYDQAAMFNRSSPGYFNNLNYAICIRRAAGYCSITYTNVRNGQMNPFQLVNRLPNGQPTVPVGQAGVDVLNCPDDYIIIDGTRLCGDRFNDGSTVSNFSMNAPVVDTSTGPIVINVRTNNNVTGLGFKLYYTQNPCTTK